MIKTSVLLGITPLDINIAADEGGSSTLSLHGVPEGAARDLRVRVRCALESSGAKVVHGDVRISDIPQGASRAGIDLAVAIEAGGLDTTGLFKDVLVLGELDMTGRVRPIRGISTMLRRCRRGDAAIIPADQEREAQDAAARGVVVYLAVNLRDVIAGTMSRAKGEPTRVPYTTSPIPITLDDVAFCGRAKRAVEIAAAGHVSVLLRYDMRTLAMPGPMRLTKALVDLLPPPEADTSALLTDIYSAAGLLPADIGRFTGRPFRAPHHTVSEAGMLGGGNPVRAGEATLGSFGVLYLAEIDEFRVGLLERFGRAMRASRIELASGAARCEFPVCPLLVGSVDGSANLDRIPDIFDMVVDAHDMARSPLTAATMRARVAAAMRVRQRRSAGSHATSAERPLRAFRVLRIAETIAALDGRTELLDADLAEADSFAAPVRRESARP